MLQTRGRQRKIMRKGEGKGKRKKNVKSHKYHSELIAERNQGSLHPAVKTLASWCQY
jgi:hypothetical protein